MMDNAKASLTCPQPQQQKQVTQASHALRGVIEGNQEPAKFPTKNPDSSSYSTGPARVSSRPVRYWRIARASLPQVRPASPWLPERVPNISRFILAITS
jgi:hypothetical protein